MANMETILGISPGTRTMGLAILRGNELIEWKIKSFKGKWSQAKLKTIIGSIIRLLEEYKVTSIGFKKPQIQQISPGLNTLLSHIHKTAKSRNIIIHARNVKELERFCSGGTKATKSIFREYVIRNYPEFQLIYRKSPLAYSQKVFEAIVAALACR